jgi:hypothetical protein
MPQSWRYARIDYNPAAAELVAATITGWAAMSGVERGPGLRQDDAAQLAADLAVTRGIIATAGDPEQTRYAVYDSGGTFLRVQTPQGPELENGETAIPIAGDYPFPPAGFKRPYDRALDPNENWARDLVLAIDRCLRDLKRTEQAGSIPAGYGIEIPPDVQLGAVPPLSIAIIVGGAAVAVIGTVATWRFLNPELRVQVASVRAAAKAYQARLAVLQTTGTMPGASPIEVANAAAVREASKDQSLWYAGIAAAAMFGIGAGAAGVSYLRRQAG